MADKKSNEPRRENGRIPTYQTAYHGAKKKDPLTNLARIIVEKFDKRRVPENTIDTIPFDQIYPDGLCRIGDNFYSKMVQFYDINYQLAQNDEKQHIFAEYCQFLNYFDETIHFQFCFINQRVDMEEYKKVISIPDQDDEFNVVRREYATYLTIYPIWLSLIAFAVVPAIVEEYVFRGVILGAYLQIEERAAVFISSLFFAMLHFSLGSVMYGFMYGCIFALVRVATGNLIYSVAMHGVFNMVNVAMAYIGITMVPGWIVLLAFSVGLAGFIILLIVFFKKNPVSLSKSSFKRRQLITREGYITLIICLCVTVMLLMM